VENKMKDLVGVITSEGNVISYKEFLNEMSGTGEIYNELHKEILGAAAHPEVFWGDVEDFLAPLVANILIEACQEDKTAYNELLISIQKTYDKLKSNFEEQQRKEQEDLEDELLYDLITIKENRFGEFDVYGQGINPRTNNVELIQISGIFQNLKNAREVAEFKAAANDCPVVEITSGNRPIFTDVNEQ